jgi:hypothetical protein
MTSILFDRISKDPERTASTALPDEHGARWRWAHNAIRINELITHACYERQNNPAPTR